MRILLITIILSLNFALYPQIELCVAPLKIGNFWKYWDKGYKKDNQTQWYRSYRVIDTITINNLGYYKVKIQTNTGMWTGYYRLTDSGYYAAYDPPYSDYIYYRKDARYNDKWQQKFAFSDSLLYSRVIDTGMVYINGCSYLGKLVENTDSVLISDWEVWTEEIGIIDFKIEQSEFQLIGWCIDGEVHGDTTLTTVNDGPPAFNKFELSQNYPNPFNPATNISYSISKRALVQLKVFDMLGREVAVLVNDVRNAGEYTVHFNAGSLPSGVYCYRLQSDNEIKSRKFILLK